MIRPATLLLMSEDFADSALLVEFDDLDPAIDSRILNGCPMDWNLNRSVQTSIWTNWQDDWGNLQQKILYLIHDDGKPS